MAAIDNASAAAEAGTRPSPAAGFHALAWRWHFYAGLYVVPFLLMLALTGLVMVFFTGFQTRLGPPVTVAVSEQGPLPVSVQAQAVLDMRSSAALREYIAPATPERASWFVVSRDGVNEAVAVNPYNAEVLQLVDKDNTWFAWAEKVHGTLLLGDVGDRLIEIAAGFAIVMIVTGLYLWWPRGGTRWARVLLPDLRLKGRLWWLLAQRRAAGVPAHRHDVDGGVGRAVRAGLEQLPGHQMECRALVGREPRHAQHRRPARGALGSGADAGAGFGFAGRCGGRARRPAGEPGHSAR